MSTQEQNSSLIDLLPDTIVELYELDTGEEDGVYRFHSGSVSHENIVVGGSSYLPLPIEASGFETRSDGQLARPKVAFANPQGIISDAIKRRGDLVGKSFTRKRIYLRFIDDVNFSDNKNPFSTPDYENRFEDDYFIINRKTNENKIFIEFELVSPLEIENIKLPSRMMIADYCPWIYRGGGCNYGRRPDYNNQKVLGSTANSIFTLAGENESDGNLGVPIADENDKAFVDPEGYNISSLTWLGDYDSTTTYSAGDFVRVSPKLTVEGGDTFSTQKSMVNKPDSFYVCIQANDSSAKKDPRFEREHWVKDQCSKSMASCKYRYLLFGKYQRGLPFGGYPSIEPFRYSV